MSKSTCSASFGSSEDKIWSLITGQSDHTWRTDLLRIEEGEKKYSVVEYYKNGDVVTAEVSMTIPHQRYECHIKGSGYEIFYHCICRISTKKNSRTILSMEEVIRRSKRKSKEKITLRIRFSLFFLKSYLKKRQKRYIEDLYKALNEEPGSCSWH